MKTTHIWTVDMISDLHAMISSSMTSVAIASELNQKYKMKFTRNAIVGKIHRLRLSNKNIPIRKRPVKETPPPSVEAAHVIKPVLDDINSTDQTQFSTLMIDLKHDECRYTNDGRHFCAAKRTSKKSYCAKHISLCYK